ncbi:trafficking protein particle complex subunit 5 isoform X2 [Anthonomus grandis grandis]|uniref:trafficking protein particle complex subunit 5 isoform X2 n=1 Tax=Anthonomus grandis grandis TaxID=2921223 RepID=UPI0021656935|nr:trafficking protein particle complex subunit 5 isoform X2 [Anthonomus grandis grandis]
MKRYFCFVVLVLTTPRLDRLIYSIFCKLWLYPECVENLHDLGRRVGVKLIDIYFVRERNGKRETKLLSILLYVKSTFWKALFGKEADKLEHSNDDENTYYLMEKEPIVNRFISIPRDKSSLNCAVFIAGIIEAILTGTGFPAKVTAHWHKGTTYMIKFEESVVGRDNQMEDR